MKKTFWMTVIVCLFATFFIGAQGFGAEGAKYGGTLKVILSMPAMSFGFPPKIRAVDEMFASVALETPLVVAVGWLATAGMLLLGQRWAAKPRTERLEDVTPWQALWIGMFQAVALVPGISRAGSTIAGGLLSGLKRDDAATFSFFIAIPAISAAALKITMEAMSLESTTSQADLNWTALAIGAVVSFLVGIASLKLLLKVISAWRLHWFAYYCIVMAVGTLLWESSRLLAGS